MKTYIILSIAAAVMLASSCGKMDCEDPSGINWNFSPSIDSTAQTLFITENYEKGSNFSRLVSKAIWSTAAAQSTGDTIAWKYQRSFAFQMNRSYDLRILVPSLSREYKITYDGTIQIKDKVNAGDKCANTLKYTVNGTPYEARSSALDSYVYPVQITLP